MWAANNLRPAYLAQGILPAPTLSCGMSIGAGRKQVIPLPPQLHFVAKLPRLAYLSSHNRISVVLHVCAAPAVVGLVSVSQAHTHPSLVSRFSNC